MNWTGSLLDCVVAVIGGCLGAAVSALGGFVLFGLFGLLGFLYLLAANSDVWIHAVTGSVLLKPSVCFVGGVVATAYARRKGLVQCGKDIGRSLVSFRRFDVLAVGGCAGLVGYLVNRGADRLLGDRLDTIALTVFVVPLFLKYQWRMTRTNDCDASSHAVSSPYRFFEKFSRPGGKTLVSFTIGLCTSGLTYALFLMPQTRPYAGLLVFFVSAVFLFPLFMGIPIPATHHFSGPAGAVAVVWLSLHTGSPGGKELLLVMLWGTATAQVALLSASIMEKFFFTEGDIHVDPPAMGMAVSTAIMLGGFTLTGVYRANGQLQVVVSLSMMIAVLGLNLMKSRTRAGTARG